MGSLIRATTLWGYGDLVRELGGDPEVFLARFGIPPAPNSKRTRSSPSTRYVRMLEASADDLGCPDFGLRLSRWQGLDILGPDRGDRAQRTDRARRVRGDRALPLRPFPRVEADARAAHRADRPHVHL